MSDVTLTRAQRAAKARRDAADRARAYRSRHRVTGTPLPRDCDAAMMEAVAFWLAREKDRLETEKVKPADVMVPLQELLKIARTVLTDRSGLDKTETTAALSRRLSERPEHRWPGYVLQLP